MILLRVARWQHIGNGLVSALKIFLGAHVVFDLEEDDWRSNDKRDRKKNPVADELGSVRDLLCVKMVDDTGTNRLDTLVEADVVGRSSTRVGQGSHKPVLLV